MMRKAAAYGTAMVVLATVANRLVPFWGSSVILVAVSGLGCLIGGWVVARLSRPRPSNTFYRPARFANGGSMIRTEPPQEIEVLVFDRHRPLLLWKETRL